MAANIQLRPLSKVAKGSAAGSLRIRCVDCGATIPYEQAQERGWGFNENGAPFSAYYCGACAGRRMSRRIAAHVRCRPA